VFVIPLSTAVQLEPLSVERKTPTYVPAKTLVSFAAMEFTYGIVKPVGVQFLPLSDERKTPLRDVPANRFVPLLAKAVAEIRVLPNELHVSPLSLEAKTWLIAPAIIQLSFIAKELI
jgi:hypothetical protein